MTGFAAIEHEEAEVRFAVRLRSINSRFLDLRVRLPAALARFEGDVHELARHRFARGKIDLDVDVLAGAVTTTRTRPDTERVREAKEGLQSMCDELGLAGTVDLAAVAAVLGPKMLTEAQDSSRDERARVTLKAAVAAGLEALATERRREGAALEADLVAGIDELARLVEAAAAGSVGIADHVRERITTRLERLQLLPQGSDDRRRIEQEVVLAAEKADIHEELVRLRAHLDAFREACLRCAEPCGKRLDFLLQEILREVNTLGSKVPRADVRAHVVSMKVTVEKLRQQVANVV